MIATSGGSCAPQQQLMRGLALGDYFESRISEQPREPIAQQHAVLGNRYAQDLRSDTRPGPGRPNAQATTERLNSIGDPAQARAALRVGPADPIVRYLHDHVAVGSGDVDRRRLRPACRSTLARHSQIT